VDLLDKMIRRLFEEKFVSAPYIIYILKYINFYIYRKVTT